jgi:hypothetical protein
MEAAAGVNLENVVSRASLLGDDHGLSFFNSKLNRTQVVQATLFDLLTGQCDRHPQARRPRPPPPLLRGRCCGRRAPPGSAAPPSQPSLSPQAQQALDSHPKQTLKPESLSPQNNPT